MSTRERVLARMMELGIAPDLQEHPAVHTLEEMAALGILESGPVCKNLFLRDASGKRHYLVVLSSAGGVDLHALRDALGSSRLSFASQQRLDDCLGVAPGAVSPLALINDGAGRVSVYFERSLAGQPRLGFHPADNTATVWMSYDDVQRYIASCGHALGLIDVEAGE